ncbi:MAG: hypothetical protein AAF620_00720 [Bacteroidota bacterium]
MPITEPSHLFKALYFSKDEQEIERIVSSNPMIFEDINWKPLGGSKSNYGVVKNQQSNPIAALIEKITNSIDAILTKKCILSGVKPNDKNAPQSMDEAIERFYPNNNWDLTDQRKRQSEEIQIIADGKGPFPQRNKHATSVIVYDNGEGQHPEDFERTFLSLLKGNKNDIHFVQGKYNMGGSGAIVFCGKKRYQLIASKRYTNDGDFGFTLIREHPKRETDQTKETWYEYLLVDGKIPSFSIDELDLGLENRTFRTGTILKLYSYQFPSGYYGFAQDLNQSINEYLYQPALPILTKDTKERYPNQKILVNPLFGLKRRLVQEKNDYLDDYFSLNFDDSLFGKMNVSCFVFKSKVKSFNVKETKQEIQRRYFKNNMSVLFSLNGQVHGHFTMEFISRSLKLNFLKSHLLIHVDCTEMDYGFRKELFMASRDRLKDGEETQALRKYLAQALIKSDRLKDIQKRRQHAVDIDTTSSSNQLLKSFTKNLPLDSNLMKLLSKTFKLDLSAKKSKKKAQPRKPGKEKQEIPFEPKRFPSRFKLRAKNDGGTEITKIPLGGTKTILFDTDVENNYFDRIEEPGDLQISILNMQSNDAEGGDAPGTPKALTEVFNVSKSSPNKGTIKIGLNPKAPVEVGDSMQLKVTLTAPGENFDEIFWVKIANPQKKKENAPKMEDEETLGIPPLRFAYKDKEGKATDAVSWEDVELATNEQMDYSTVMVPEAEGESLKQIFVNMESTVLMDYKSTIKNANEEQIQIANRKYFTSVYFHTLFLYTITKNRGYQIQRKDEEKEDLQYVDVGTYLKDLFDNHYSSFILNYGGMEEIMQGVGD